MRQSYKLRLGDGTILVVDRGGLGNWLTDPSALVQPAGGELWTPLRTFLLRERKAARRAERHRPKPPSTPRDALPLVYPKPLETLVRADGLPLIPPPQKPPDDPPAPVPRAPTPAQTPLLPHAPPLPPVPPPLPPNRPDTGLGVRSSLAHTPPAPPPPIQPAGRDHSVSSTPVETGARPASWPAPQEPPLPDAESVSPCPPGEEDVGWMTLDVALGDEPPGPPVVSWLDAVPSSSPAAPPKQVEESPRPARPRAPSAPNTVLSRWIDGLARHWRATRLRLRSHAASAYEALVALWRGLGHREHPVSSPPGAPPRRAVDAGGSAPVTPPTTGAPPGERVHSGEKAGSATVYRPRLATDGLPLLQVQPLDDEHEGGDSSRGSGGQRSTEDLPESVLEPLD